MNDFENEVMDAIMSHYKSSVQPSGMAIVHSVRALFAGHKHALAAKEAEVVELKSIAKAARRFANAHSEAALAVKDGPEYRAACDELFAALEAYEGRKELT